MKLILIIAIPVFVISIIAFLFLYRPDNTKVMVGTTKDLEGHIGQMMVSTAKHPFIIAIVQGTNEFV